MRPIATFALAVLLLSPTVAADGGNSSGAPSPQGESQEKAKTADRPVAPPEAVDMAEMMARARKFTGPGEHHALLDRFLGNWQTELRFTMQGMNAPAEKGTSVGSWLMEGRWVQLKGKGTTMGMPSESFMILGYDNFKMSYVTASVTSLDTALLTSEGDLDPGGEALLTYGTLDEYLTGEHDKMVKYVWRFVSDDEMTLEIHDLPIGEKNTKVLEMRFTRAR
ncbi:MAG: DUF1579 domain-containing protein [Holophagales bacterium]|nr:DUF1579 domain-containing protein [Holophagales bacterium]